MVPEDKSVPERKPKSWPDGKFPIKSISFEVFHIQSGCVREWPHVGVECGQANIVLGEE